MKRAFLFVIIILTLLNGCTTYNSSYENYSKDGQNYIVAKGEAAANAALNNSSQATLGLGGERSNYNEYNRYNQYNKQNNYVEQAAQQIYRSTINNVSNEINRTLSDLIRESFR